MPAGMLFTKRNENRAWSQVISRANCALKENACTAGYPLEGADRIEPLGSSSRCSHAYCIMLAPEMLIFTILQLVEVSSPFKYYFSNQNYFGHISKLLLCGGKIFH